DRVDTTATVWLGVTLGCARCHDHKYDPFTQEEFYRLFAYFNNIPEHGRAVKVGNSPPFIQAPTPYMLEQRRKLDGELAEARRRVEELKPELVRARSEWERSLPSGSTPSWTVTEGLHRVRGSEDKAAGKFGYFDKFSLSARVRGVSGTIVSRMDLSGCEEGYHVHLEQGRIQVNLVKRWLDDAIRVETERALEPGKWHHVTVTYDGSRAAAGIAVYVDGKPERLKVQLDFLNQSFATDHPFRVGAGREPFRGEIDDVRLYSRRLSKEEAAWIADADPV